MSSGKTRDNKDITGSYGSTYKEVTENFWAKAYPPESKKPKSEGQNYNMEWSGDFMAGIELIVNESSAEFWSKDSKTEIISIEYKDIFGLQPEKLQELISRVIYPAFMNQIREVLHLSN